MKSLSRNLGYATIAVAISSSVPVASAQDLAGRWAATSVTNRVTIPFRLDISVEGSQIIGMLSGSLELQRLSAVH
jgi:hypothetical protein